jgi:hypothetical protein
MIISSESGSLGYYTYVYDEAGEVMSYVLSLDTCEGTITRLVGPLRREAVTEPYYRAEVFVDETTTGQDLESLHAAPRLEVCDRAKSFG